MDHNEPESGQKTTDKQVSSFFGLGFFVRAASGRPSIFARVRALFWVRYVLGVFGTFLSMLPLTLALIMGALLSSDTSTQKVSDVLRVSVSSVLGFVFPEYLISVDQVRLNFDRYERGLFVIRQVTLIDPLSENRIYIDSFRFTPEIFSIFFGEAKLDYLDIKQVRLRYALPSGEALSLGNLRENIPAIPPIPINILDIPRAVMGKNSLIRIQDVGVEIYTAKNVLIAILSDLSARYEVNQGDYKMRLQTEIGSADYATPMTLRASKTGDHIEWAASARDYPLDPDGKKMVTFDFRFGFDNVPAYNLSGLTQTAGNPIDFITSGDGLLRANLDQTQLGGRFIYEPETKIFRLANMQATGQNYDAHMTLDIDPGHDVIFHGYDISLKYQGENEGEDLILGGAGFEGAFNFVTMQGFLGSLWVKNPFMHLWGSGQFGLYENELELHLDQINSKTLRELWPRDFASKLRAWWDLRIGTVDLENIRIHALNTPSLGTYFDLAAKLTEARLRPVNFLPEISVDQSKLYLSQAGLTLDAPSGKLGEKIALSDVQFSTSSLFSRPVIGRVAGNARGEASDTIRALSVGKLALDQKMRVTPEQVSGHGEAKIDISFPMKAGSKINDMKLDIKADIKDAKITKYILGKDVEASKIALSIQDQDLTIEGPAQIEGLYGNFKMTQFLEKNHFPKIAITTEMAPKDMQIFGVTLPDFIQGDKAQAQADVTLRRGGMDLQGIWDLQKTSVDLPVVGKIKEMGDSGQARFTVSTHDKKLDDIALDLDLGPNKGQGRALISNQKFTGIVFDHLHINGVYDGEVAYMLPGTLLLRHGRTTFGGLNFNNTRKTQAKKNPLDIRVEDVRFDVTDTIYMDQISGRILAQDKLTGEVTGRVGHVTPVRVRLSEADGNFAVEIYSNDAGGALRHAGLFSDLNQGSLWLVLQPTGQKGFTKGQLRINDAKLTGARALGRKLQMISLLGPLDGDQMHFEKIRADFIFAKEKIQISRALAFGPSLGLTAEGNIWPERKYVDMTGTATPAYVINGLLGKIPLIGPVIAGPEGEGVLGVNFWAYGPVGKIYIEINPLSVLTPGSLREIWNTRPSQGTQNMPQDVPNP